METKKNFKVGDTVKCTKDNVTYQFESCPNNIMFDRNQEYIIEDISGSSFIKVYGCHYHYTPDIFVKVLKTAKDKELLLDYLKSTCDLYDNYIQYVENAIVFYDSGVVVYDLITMQLIDNKLCNKRVFKFQSLLISNIELFGEAQKKLHNDVQAQILAERKAERITKMGKEIMAEILKQDKFLNMYTLDTDETKDQLARNLFQYFTEHKPQLYETIEGIMNITITDNDYSCAILGKPYDPKIGNGDIKGRLKMTRTVSKKYLENFLHSKIKPSKPEPTRPTLGLVPIEIRERDFKIKRFNEVCAAISRRYDANENIPIDWIDEYNSLVKFVKDETKQGV